MWIALFSQTGYELAEIIEQSGQKPDRIITNNNLFGSDPLVDTRLDRYIERYPHEKIIRILQYTPDDCLVTLHGYLKIIPPEALKPNMFNGHPGDIVKYPELKGRDPQERAVILGLPSTGVVIHRVTEDIDGGEIIKRAEYKMDPIRDIHVALKEVSINLWCEFLMERQQKSWRPSHYSVDETKIECIAAIQQLCDEHQNDTYTDYNRYQSFKYLWRLGRKGDVLGDLKKARQFLDFAIEGLENE